MYRVLALVIATVTIGACATPDGYHLMATPVVYKDPELNFESQIPPAKRSVDASMYYETRRAPVAAGEPGYYGDEPSDEVRIGVATIQLAPSGWTFEQFRNAARQSTAEKPMYGKVERIEELGTVRTGQARTAGERELIARINAQLAGREKPEVILYVHGYRVTFDEVAVMMGSLSANLGYNVTTAFAWPTGQHWWNYLSDCPNAEKYIPDIERMIDLLSRTKARYVNLLAYSCGSPLLAEALAHLRTRFPDDGHEALAKRYRIGTVIFAASDIDLKTFARDHIPPIMDLSQQTIVYISRRDAALGFSSIVAGASRIGRPDIDELSHKDVERIAADPRLQAINVTNVRGSHEMGGISGHGYWYANEWIATDVLLALRYPIPPEKRCLERMRGKSNTWTFPTNYADCVSQRLLDAYPELKRVKSP